MTLLSTQTKKAIAWTIAGATASLLALSMVSLYGPLRVVVTNSVLTGAAILPPTDAYGHTNVLLLGVRDEELSASDLTDTMIVASIDRPTRSVMLLSIPRDLMILDTPEAEPIRINELYADYKAVLRRQGLSENGASLLALQSLGKDIGRRLNTNIQGVIKVDFSGFSDIIDAVGGIDIDVQERLVDPYYPVRDGVPGTLAIEPGLHHFDGAMALRYARSRATTSDFDRSRRQQEIIRALVLKVKGRGMLRGLGSLGTLYEVVRAHTETTLSLRELTGLAGILSTLSANRIIRMQLNYTIGGDLTEAEAGGFVLSAPKEIAGSGALLMPMSLSGNPSDWGQLQLFSSLLFAHREIYLRAPLVSVASAGGSPLQLQRLRNELLRYGFAVKEEEKKQEKPTKAPSIQEEDSSIIAGGTDLRHAEFFGELLGIPVGIGFDLAPDEVRVLLGKSYRFQPLQKLAEERETRPE